VVSDINHIYSDLIKTNNELKSPVSKALGPTNPDNQELYKTLYNSVKQIQGIDKADSTEKTNKRNPVGFLKTIIGSNQVKHGYFQSKLLARNQDIIGRGVVSVDPSLGMDQIGVPEPMAWVLYGPHVIGQLVKNGYTTEKAMAEVEQRTPVAKNVLLAEMKERPVTAKRDPVLHKFGVMAFNPHLETGKQIKVSPLIVKGPGMDFDGDTYTLTTPMARDSIKDAYNMLPSKNLFNPLDKSLMHVPGQEAIVGVYQATTPAQSKPVKVFKTKKEALDAYNRGEIKINDRITVTSI
jgi:DNA-directed RNA polymerase subunit beta'